MKTEGQLAEDGFPDWLVVASKTPKGRLALASESGINDGSAIKVLNNFVQSPQQV